HRLHLGRIAFCRIDQSRRKIEASEIKVVRQELDLWRGRLQSVFELDAARVSVTTAVHPTEDLLAVDIESELVRRGVLGVSVQFPYGSPEMSAADWKQTDKHQTKIIERGPNQLRLLRSLDGGEYQVSIRWEPSANISEIGPHALVLKSEPDKTRLSFIAHFTPGNSESSDPTVYETFRSAEQDWRHFWSNGGAIDLAGSSNPRAHELERRIVLSQYLTAIQCSGSMPPQETGLTVNSWYGKFHLE